MANGWVFHGLCHFCKANKFTDLHVGGDICAKAGKSVGDRGWVAVGAQCGEFVFDGNKDFLLAFGASKVCAFAVVAVSGSGKNKRG